MSLAWSVVEFLVLCLDWTEFVVVIVSQAPRDCPCMDSWWRYREMSIYYHLVLISFEYCLRYEMGCECVLPCDGVCSVRPDVTVILYSSQHVVANKYVHQVWPLTY